MTGTIISTRDLQIMLGRRTILKDVDVDIAASEIVTIVGPNGSGKSTLLRALIGAIRPTRGLVTHAPALRSGYVP